jgi:uncharacterized membrane protein
MIPYIIYIYIWYVFIVFSMHICIYWFLCIYVFIFFYLFIYVSVYVFIYLFICSYRDYVYIIHYIHPSLRKQLGSIFDRLKLQILKRSDQLRDFVEEAAQSKAREPNGPGPGGWMLTPNPSIIPFTLW